MTNGSVLRMKPKLLFLAISVLFASFFILPVQSTATPSSGKKAESLPLLPIPDPPTDGATPCSTTPVLLTPAVPCPSGLTCVLTSFGFIAADVPNAGTCQTVPSPVQPCTVQFCSSTPTEDAICQVTTGEVATCIAWATRTDGSEDVPVCPEICTLECLSPLLVASDGSTYCNGCLLSGASCDADFSFYGPVDAPPSDELDCEKEENRAQCCAEKQEGCKDLGESCSTKGSRIAPIPCVDDTTCVISDFGKPSVDIPNSGTCLPIKRRIKNCSVRLCAEEGEEAVCQLPLEGIVTTCGAWSKRTDGGRKPNCGRGCRKHCVYPSYKRPKASNFKRYCSLCFLTFRSCQAGFKFFGPIGPVETW